MPGARTSVSVTRAAAVGMVTALLLAGCSGGGDSPAAQPSASPSSSTAGLPPGLNLTDPGSDLTFGDTATVQFNPNQNRGSVLQVTVKSVRKGSVKDLAGFVLDARAKAAGYFYVNVAVANLGEGDVGGTAVPLWGVDDENTLLPAVDFTTTFDRCPSEPLPTRFGPGDELETCLVYQVPTGGLAAVSFRPTQDFDPIQWTGELTERAPKPTKKR